MTKKEIDKLRKWNFGKKPINGYITLFPESLKYLKYPSYYDIECAEQKRTIHVSPDHMGFKINENSISCKTQSYSGIPSRKENIPFKYIQSVRFYNYNY